MLDFSKVKGVDPEIYDVLAREYDRVAGNLELIASENFVSEAVMAVAGSHLTNKYAEGYPGKRYYGGCEVVDEAERLAIERAKKLFGADHANVQPHSGSQANTAVYFGALEQGDTVMGMNLSHGGHLTHGSPVNISGKTYNFVPYGVDAETEMIDYENVYSIAQQCRPKMIVVGASAYPRSLDFARFRQIADSVGAYLMVDMAHIAGLVAAGVHESPVPHADFVTTTTHKTLRGPRGGMILCKAEHQKLIDKAIFPGIQGGPLMHIVAAKAVCLKEAMSDEFAAYQRRIVANAAAMAKRFTENGMRLVSGGTDNHLMLMDVYSKGVTGKELEAMLDRAHITVNKNTIPTETLSPFVTSGVRIGTPAVTTRGMGEEQMIQIADLVTDVVVNREAAIERVGQKVGELCREFPLYE